MRAVVQLSVGASSERAEVGTMQLDAKQRAKSGEFEKACRVEKARRESEGVGDSCENMQPVEAPALTLGMRLERLCWPSTL